MFDSPHYNGTWTAHRLVNGGVFVCRRWLATVSLPKGVSQWVARGHYYMVNSAYDSLAPHPTPPEVCEQHKWLEGVEHMWASQAHRYHIQLSWTFTQIHRHQANMGNCTYTARCKQPGWQHHPVNTASGRGAGLDVVVRTGNTCNRCHRNTSEACIIHCMYYITSPMSSEASNNVHSGMQVPGTCSRRLLHNVLCSERT